MVLGRGVLTLFLRKRKEGFRVNFRNVLKMLPYV